jgi:protein ImuA
LPGQADGLPGGLPNPTLSEVLPAPGAEAGATAFVLAHLRGRRAPLLWIQDRLSARETGRPYLPGLGLAGPLLAVTLSHPRDALIAAEDALRCTALAGVVVEIWGTPAALDFTATKRLALRVAAAGPDCWLIRHRAAAVTSAARERWRIAPLPSAANPDDPSAPGAARWRAELFRSRHRRPGDWLVQHDRATHRLDFAAAVPDRALAAPDRAAGQRGAG